MSRRVIFTDEANNKVEIFRNEGDKITISVHECDMEFPVYVVLDVYDAEQLYREFSSELSSLEKKLAEDE